jgi:hypothetical protein
VLGVGKLSRFSVLLRPENFWGFLVDSRSRLALAVYRGAIVSARRILASLNSSFGLYIESAR